MSAIITNTGIANIANALNGGAHTPPQHIGWGTGTTAAAAGDTGLETPVDQPRVEGTKSVVTENVTNDTYQVVGTLTALGTVAITEVGLFDAAGAGNPPTGGDIYVRSVFTAINLEEDDSIQFTIKSTFVQPV